MQISHSKLQDLVSTTCDRVRRSPRQSIAAIVRESRRRLANDPADAEAKHVVAADSLLRDQPARTLELLEHDRGRPSLSAIGNRIAGYASFVRDDHHHAHHYLDQSVRIDPTQTDCWTLLGHIAAEFGQTQGAVRFYERAIMFDEKDHESAIALAGLHARHHRLQDAIHTLRVCLLRDRRSPKLNLALGRLLRRRATLLGRGRHLLRQQRLLQESLQCFAIVNAAAPTAASWVAQGELQQQLGDFESARRSFALAVQAEPKSSLALTRLANSNVDAGDIDDAIAQYELALSIDPDHPNTHFRYCRAKKFKRGAASATYARQLRTLLMNASLSDAQKIHLNFALAKVLDDTKCYDEAWKCYDQGNRLKPKHSRSTSKRSTAKKSTRFSFQQVAADSERLFTREFFASHPTSGNESRTPIFIVGMPRSGTTLTEQILSSHPAIAGAGELPHIEQIRRQLIAASSVPRTDGKKQVRKDLYPQLLYDLSSQQLSMHAAEYLSRLQNFRTSESRVTDKMPTNFMHLGMIAMLFPGATVIHCRRHPMDVICSCFCQNLTSPFCDLRQLADYHRNYRRIMRHWQQVLPIQIHTVDYESIVSDPETHSRKMLAHCGLPWDAKCLDFHRSRRAVHTPSKWQVRQPMYKSSLQKWRRFENQLGPLAEQIEAEIRMEESSNTLIQ